MTTPFLTWAWKSNTAATAATRTAPARATDVFNVRDYGAVGDNVTNDAPAIQAAIDAAQSNYGGIVFFPAGKYKITATLLVGMGAFVGQKSGISFLGSGGHADNVSNSYIWGSLANKYLLYVNPDSGGYITSIQGLAFENTAVFSFSSVEPILPLARDGNAYDGGGCVYVGNGQNTAIWNCDIKLQSGCGIYYGGIAGLDVQVTSIEGAYPIRPFAALDQITWTAGSPNFATVTTHTAHGFVGTFTVIIFNASISGYNVQNVTATVTDATHFTYPLAVDPGGTATSGSYIQAPQYDGVSFGVVSHCPSRVSSCKLFALGTAVNIWKWGVIAENIDEELCGTGFAVGNSRLGYYDNDMNTYKAQFAVGGAIDCYFRAVNTESNFVQDYMLYGGTQMSWEDCSMQTETRGAPLGGIVVPNTGSIHRVLFKNCDIDGYWLSAAIDFSLANAVGDVIFINVEASSSIGSVYKRPPNNAYNGVTENPPVFINVNFDYSVPFAAFSLAAPTQPSTVDILVNDSNTAGPTFGGPLTATNLAAALGKTVVGGSSNKVFVRWNGSNWVITG